MIRTLTIVLVFALYVALSCVDPYDPPEIESSTNYLVVDGIVDLADPESRIKLTRSQNLDEKGEPLPEVGAQVIIEVENGPSFVLPEIAPGEYSASGVSVNEGEVCRLRILPSFGQGFISDPVTYKPSPPIDSITWTSREHDLEFEVTTHDSEGNSRYYRWKTEETVMYSSVHNSSYIWDPELQMVRTRYPEELIYYCWKTTPFSAIEVFSTKGLVQDAVVKRRVSSMPINSWKLRIRYSLLVRQFVIDENEFNFWTELRKNTESIGTIFDPQPTQITGNIRSMDSSGPKALGYFSVNRSVEKRIFVSVSNLPPPSGGYESTLPFCSPFAVDTIPIPEYLMSNKTALIINGVSEGGPAITAYTTAESPCIDCRIVHGGVNRKPDFWE